jgi:WD40 repeat protein
LCSQSITLPQAPFAALACILCLPACSGVVLRVVFHPKQLMLVSGGDDAEVRVWDLVTKSCAAGDQAPRSCLQAVPLLLPRLLCCLYLHAASTCC